MKAVVPVVPSVHQTRSSVSPERWEHITPQPLLLQSFTASMDSVMVPILGGHSEASSPLEEATTTGGGESKSKPSHFVIFHISWGHSIYHWRFFTGITHKWDWYRIRTWDVVKNGFFSLNPQMKISSPLRFERITQPFPSAACMIYLVYLGACGSYDMWNVE